MIHAILFVIIGLKLNMSTSYYVLVGISFLISSISTMIKFYQIGKESKEDEI